MLDSSWSKIFVFFGVWAAVWLPIAFILSRLIGWQPNQPLAPKQKIVLLLSLYILAPVVLAWQVRLEKLSLIDLGLGFNSHILADVILGLVISLTSLIIIFVAKSALNLVSWHRENIKNLLPLLAPILALSLLVSAIEEIVFRGYIFSTLLTDNSFWLAAISSSAIFALLHLIWERKETAPQIPGLWLMGMVLIGAVIINQGHIYLALGLHAGWIWGLTCIDSAQLLTYNYKNHWFTGINQQPLAGVAGISCLTLAGLTLWLVSAKSLLL